MAWAIRSLEILFAWSVLLQTLEFLRLQPLMAPASRWAWSIQRRDISPQWIRQLFDFCFVPLHFQVILCVRLAVSLVILVAGGSLSLVVILFVCQWLILLRWRGAFNGGSDFMTLVVLTGQLLAHGVGSLGDTALGWKAGFWYITLHALASYFVSGWVKVLHSEWRNGTAIVIFLNAAIYGPLSPQHILRIPWIAKLATWAFIAWECSFPLALLHPIIAAAYCCAAVLFHFLVFWYFGLNRFFWAWLASFPAIIWCSYNLALAPVLF